MKKLEFIRHVFLRILIGKFYSPNFFAAEKNVHNKMPGLKSKYSFFKRLSCFLSGFNSDKLVWYDFESYNKKDYISDLVHYRDFEKIDWKYYYIAHNKLVCERFFSHYCNFIPTLSYIEKGVFFDISNDGKGFSSVEQLTAELMKGGEFYLKPYDGGSGRGIGKLWVENGIIYWNSQVIKDNNLSAFCASLSGYLVQRRFEQKGYLHEVNPSTLNTLRVVTMLHPKTKEPFVACAIQRFGRIGALVDNIAQKGLLCPVDIETGILAYSVVYPSEGILKKIDVHPDSGIQISGIKIPCWERVVELCKRLAMQVPFMPLCGWDVVVSGDEIFIQELNYNPDIYLGQILKPLLLNEQVKEFYNYYCG